MRTNPKASLGPGWWVADQEAQSIAQAAALKAANPNIQLFPYITGFMAQNWFQQQAAFDQANMSDWWLKDPVSGVPIDCNATAQDRAACYGYSQGAPGKLYDWRIPAVRDYWTEKVIAPYVTNENISGIFMDDTTDVADRKKKNHNAPCLATKT